MSDKNICLITPPSPFLLDERVFMHLGILKVASALEAQGYKIDFLDLSGVEGYDEVLQTYVESHSNVKIFGLTATTPQIPFAFNVCTAIREHQPTAKFILGGTHASLMHSAKKKEDKKGIPGRATKDINILLKYFDVIVAGDGEKAIFEALKTDKGIVDADNPKGDLFLNNQDSIYH